MRTRIMKVKDWLKFRRPDYDGFREHVEAWDDAGIPYGLKDLMKLQKSYNLPIPRFVNGQVIFDVVIEPKKSIAEIEINISPTSNENI
jgi:hypothetical protein